MTGDGDDDEGRLDDCMPSEVGGWRFGEGPCQNAADDWEVEGGGVTVTEAWGRWQWQSLELIALNGTGGGDGIPPALPKLGCNSADAGRRRNANTVFVDLSAIMRARLKVCVRACACVRACVRACVFWCVRASVCPRMSVRWLVFLNGFSILTSPVYH